MENVIFDYLPDFSATRLVFDNGGAIGLSRADGIAWAKEKDRRTTEALDEIQRGGDEARAAHDGAVNAVRSQADAAAQQIANLDADAQVAARKVADASARGDAALDLRLQLDDAARRRKLLADYIADLRARQAKAEGDREAAGAAAESRTAAAVLTKLLAEDRQARLDFLTNIVQPWKAMHTTRTAIDMVAQRVNKEHRREMRQAEQTAAVEADTTVNTIS